MCIFVIIQSIFVEFMTLGEKITMLRKKKSLSQLELADKVGVSRDTIGKYERNDITPTVDKAKKIADIINVSLDYLVSDKAELSEKIVDKIMEKRVHEIELLSPEDKDKILSIVDAFIRDTKTKKAYA
tara:strand:+ start:609 stop:992 length:384 start_codon:yes stop_codon:yes gene_type:complete